MTLINSMYLRDEVGAAYGVKHVSNKPRVSSMPYLYDIAEGNVSGHANWTKIGYTPTMTTAVSDLWSLAGAYVFPPSAMQMEVVSSNAADAGVVGFSGNSTGGSTTTLIDASKDFTAGTPAAVGDLVILDTTHEIGIVTNVAATILTVGDGFAHGGSGAGQAYRVVDLSAGGAGAQVIWINYLDAAWTDKEEFVVLNGTTEVATVATTLYRINGFQVVFAGVNGVPTGNLSLRETDNAPVYSYITAGFTRARSSYYTVPAGKILYVTTITGSYGYSSNSTHYCRLFTRATQQQEFRTPGIFYPFTEFIVANNSQAIELSIPTKIVQKVDLKVSGIATFSGIATIALRGWLE